ncbi:MAG: hypothetical protein WC867_04320 [Candidatus Pacearchaeota archaeon]|jgi:hypothetical protein
MLKKEKKKSETIPGTLRIKHTDLKTYEKTNNDWKKNSKEFPNAYFVIDLYKAHGNENLIIIDKVDERFVKGQLSPDGKCQGARINQLPDGRKIDKAFSLFAEDLTIHPETSHSHWDVIYKNPNGKYAYCYTLDKVQNSKKIKYNLVKEFEKKYDVIYKKAYSNLNNKENKIHIAIFTLLKTYMRVGNEIYYKIHNSKGLTTLKKSDVKINGNRINFKYIEKGGVPMEIEEEFPDEYVNTLKRILSELKDDDFIFTGKDNKPLKDTDFESAFQEYTGIKFYPHIVRSYYATKSVEDFLDKKKEAEKKEVRDLFLSIAEKLGHKKFNKKHNAWENSPTVTISHYINPELLEKVEKITK